MSKRKIIFLVGLLIIQLCLIWPIYPMVSTIEPMILGLPFSFAWVVIVLIAAFSLLLWYYLSDPKINDEAEG